MKTRIIGLTISIVLLWWLFPAPALAQGGEGLGNPCVAHPGFNYADFTYNDLIDDSTGWAVGQPGSQGSFPDGENYGYVGSTFGWGEGTFSQTLNLPNEFTALRVSITGYVYQRATVTVGDGPQGLLTWPSSTESTQVVTIAQGIDRSGIGRVTVYAEGPNSILRSINIVPIDPLEKATQAIQDPGFDGVNWPSWYQVESYSPTVTSAVGSRRVGGTFAVGGNAWKKYCTSTYVNKDLAFGGVISTTVDYQLASNSYGRISAGIFESPAETIDDSKFSEVQYLPATGASWGTWSFTSPVNIDLNNQALTQTQSVPAYFCWRGFSAGVTFDNFDLPDCATADCEAVLDHSFELDYQYTPTPDLDPRAWRVPVAPPGFDIIYHQPPIAGGLLVLSSTTQGVSAPLDEPWPANYYTVTVHARAAGVQTSSAPALGVGLTNSEREVATLNHLQFNGVRPPAYITFPLTTEFETYTQTITNTTAGTITTVLFADMLQGGQQIEVNFVCLQGVGRAEICLTIPDPTFTQGLWKPIGNAAFTPNGLLLGEAGFATLTPVTPTLTNAYYAARLGVYNLPQGSNVMQIEFDNSITRTETFTLSASGLVTVPLGYIDDFSKIVLKGISSTVELNYFCIVASGVEVQDCYVFNGDFSTKYGWHYANGAAWNSTSYNAYLPYQDGGTWENVGLGIFGQVLPEGPLPTPDPGEYLILGFDARTPVGGGGANITAVLREESGNALPSQFPATSEAMRYEADVTPWAGREGLSLYFVNNSYQYTQTNDLIVDNVCLFTSPFPPKTFGDTESPNPDIETTLSCDSISAWLTTVTAVDFLALEALGAQSLLSTAVTDWVPWLGAKLWLHVAKPIICFLLAMFESGPIAGLLNIALWAFGSADGFIRWTFENMGVLGAWFNFFGQLALLAYDYAVDIPGWALESQQGFGAWLWGLAESWVVDTLNFFIRVWNQLMPSFSAGVSEFGNIFMEIWNDSIVPIFSDILSYVSTIQGIASTLFEVLFIISPEIRLIFSLFFGLIEVHGGSFLSFLSAPIKFFNAFNTAIDAPGMEFMPACYPGQELDAGCLLYAGISLFSQTIGDYILMPLVVLLITFATFFYFWRTVWPLLRGVFR